MIIEETLKVKVLPEADKVVCLNLTVFVVEDMKMGAGDPAILA